ncbi:MAG: hypothetical protein IJ371_04195 [Clostridia bacterium]|nr:hypothetical protein [Clostridia bacterium]
MASYSDNVRKLHGRINIIYSDGDRLFELNFDVSDNAEVSNPLQVVEKNGEPTCKACTMDGNCTMGGGYQMVDNSVVTGWWNNVLSNADGSFNQPYPYLAITFVTRPVMRWTIIGDSKLNQYPVDFNLYIYDNNNALIDTIEIRNNNKVVLTLNFDNAYVDIIKMKLEVHKWSKGNAKVKILNFFDIADETYEGSDLKSFEILEELATDDANVPYGINSDTLSIVIYNRGRKFDQGYLRELLLTDRKITPYIGIEQEDGTIDYVNMGTFYSQEWEVPQDDQWVKCKCYDRLMSFQKHTYLGFPLTSNVSLLTIIKHIFASVGLLETEYSIDAELDKIIVPHALLGKMSVWEALQEVCNAGLCKIYLDRNNKVRVTVEKSVVNNGITINPSLLFSYNKQNTNNNFSNKVEVEYTDILATQTTTESVYSSRVSIDPHSKVSMTIDYSKMVTDAYLSYLPVTDIQLNKFETSSNAGRYELENTSDKVQVVEVEVIGRAISMVTQVVEVEEGNSVRNYGEMLYKHPSSILVQTYARALEIGEYMLKTHITNTGVLKVNWRGNPDLQLEDKFTCVDRFGNPTEYINQYNRFVFDGGLKQDIRAKEFKDE